jgi:hypothetical protein
MVHYPDNYPDELPELSLDLIEGEVDEDEINALLAGAHAVVSIAHTTHEFHTSPDTELFRVRKIWGWR